MKSLLKEKIRQLYDILCENFGLNLFKVAKDFTFMKIDFFDRQSKLYFAELKFLSRWRFHTIQIPLIN